MLFIIQCINTKGKNLFKNRECGRKTQQQTLNQEARLRKEMTFLMALLD